MEEIKFPLIYSSPKSGLEPLIDSTGKEVSKLSDFWQWAYSNLIDNAQRGVLAEYIVACALNIQRNPRINWDKYDLISNDGITIEIKTSAYLQTWGQKKLSNLTFGIQPTFGWNQATNEYDDIKMRQADIYVFCIHKHQNPLSVNPLDLNQWEFYVLKTATLNNRVGNQKTITINKLKSLDARYCCFEDLKATISAEYKNRG